MKIDETVRLVAKQGEMLKNFNKSEEFFQTVGLSESIIHLKINLYKFIAKYSVSKKLTLPLCYFKNNFKTIKVKCKGNANIFQI